MASSSSSPPTMNDHISRYWGTVEEMSHESMRDGDGQQNSPAGPTRRPKAAVEPPLPTPSSSSAYDLAGGALDVLNELDTPLWLFDTDARRNVWANAAALRLYGMPLEGFVGLASARFEAPFLAEVGKVVSDGGRRKMRDGDCGHFHATLPALDPKSPHRDEPFSLVCKPFAVKGAAVIDGAQATPSKTDGKWLCLLRAEHLGGGAFLSRDAVEGPESPSVRAFGTPQQSLRALEMLKSSPIFSFLFTHDGGLLMANPRAVTFYRALFGGDREMSLQSVLSVGNWDKPSFPDEEENPRLKRGWSVARRVQHVVDRCVHALFEEGKESYRVQLLIPRRHAPGRFRWVEMEMWAAKDPVTHVRAILMNQTNMQDTKKMELDLKLKQAQLQSQNEMLQLELEQAMAGEGGAKTLDLDSTVDKTLNLLDNFTSGKQPTQGEVDRLKKAIKRGTDLRAPDKLEEMLLSANKGFGGEVGLSLFELLQGNPAQSNEMARNDSGSGGSGAMATTQSRGNSMKSLLEARSGSSNTNASASDAQEGTSEEGRMGGSGGGGSLASAGVAAAGVSCCSEEEELAMVEEQAALLREMDASCALKEALEQVDAWFFDAFALDRASGGHPLSIISFHLMERLNLLHTFKIDAKRFFMLLLRIERGYPSNAYHNRTHAANVVQSMYMLMTRGMGPDVAGDAEMLAGLLSAIVHDFEHKGLTTDFLIRYQDDLALRYNDRSPLENHHISAAFHLMLSERYNLFEHMSIDQYHDIRKLMVEMVLATDMKQHFEILGRFRLIETKLFQWNEYSGQRHQGSDAQGDGNAGAGPSGGASHPPEIREDNLASSIEDDGSLFPEDRSLALQMCLKCADVGHVYCKPEVHLKWVQRLEQENFNQGDQEKERGQAVTSALMDREKGGITKSQCGFFQIVVLPLYESLGSAFPSVTPLTDSIYNNFRLWQRIEEDQLEISEVY